MSTDEDKDRKKIRRTIKDDQDTIQTKDNEPFLGKTETQGSDTAGLQLNGSLLRIDRVLIGFHRAAHFVLISLPSFALFTQTLPRYKPCELRTPRDGHALVGGT